MFDEIYEVERTDYAGFKAEIKPDATYTERAQTDQFNILKCYSLKTNKLLYGQQENRDTGEMTYYVINMPDEDECKPPPQIRLVELQSKEEVEALFNAINKMLQEQKHD